jgi:hypothetical protein
MERIYKVFSNLLGLGTTVLGDAADLIIALLALGCVAMLGDYVTTLNPARYIRKRVEEFQENILDRYPLDKIRGDDDAPGQDAPEGVSEDSFTRD